MRHTLQTVTYNMLGFQEQGSYASIHVRLKSRYLFQKPLIMEKNGVKIGILSYCDLNTCTRTWRGMKAGPAMLKVDRVVEEVESLRSKVFHIY